MNDLDDVLEKRIPNKQKSMCKTPDGQLALDVQEHEAGQCGHDEANIWGRVRDE